MEDREGFVENSKVAFKGVINGIFGAVVYEVLIVLLFSIIVSTIVASKNPGATQAELEVLTTDALDSFPFSVLSFCLGNLIMLVVFAFIIKLDKFKQILKKLICSKTLKYGLIGSIFIIGFSVIYNSSVAFIFNLDNSGNSNQQAVVSFIENNVIVGLFSVVMLAPLVEEFTYRYCLFGGVSRKNKVMGYIISGGVFALMHFVSSVMEYGFTRELLIDFIYLPPYLFSGLSLCYMYDKSENLGSSFIAHFMNNLISFLGIVCL